MNDRHATELTSVSSGLASTPSLKVDLNLLIVDTLVLQKLDDGVRARIGGGEVLNLDSLA